MHLSMLSPRVGGAGRTRGIWHFHESQSQIPHPWAPRKCRLPTPGYRFSLKAGLSYVKFPIPGQKPNVRIPTQGKARRVNFPWVVRPTLGFNIFVSLHHRRCSRISLETNLSFNRKIFLWSILGEQKLPRPIYIFLSSLLFHNFFFRLNGWVLL